MNVQELTAKLKGFRDKRDWSQYHTPKNLAMALSAECGELLELFMWKNDSDVRKAMQNPEFRVHVYREIADVQIFLLYLADALGVDLERAVKAKILDNAQKYPEDCDYPHASTEEILRAENAELWREVERLRDEEAEERKR